MDKGENFWTVERIVEWHKKSERIAKLEVEIDMLREGLMRIKTMRLQMPLANCIPVIDALLKEKQE